MRTVFKGQDRFEQLVARAKAENWKMLPIGERTAVVGQAMVGSIAPSHSKSTTESVALGQFHRGSIAGPFLKPRSPSRGCWMSRKRIGPRRSYCATSKLIVTDTPNAPENISLASIILKIGYTTMTGAAWVSDLTRSLGGVQVPHSACPGNKPSGWRHYRYLDSIIADLLRPLAEMEAEVFEAALRNSQKSRGRNRITTAQWRHYGILSRDGRYTSLRSTSPRGPGVAHVRRHPPLYACLGAT